MMIKLVVREERFLPAKKKEKENICRVGSNLSCALKIDRLAFFFVQHLSEACDSNCSQNFVMPPKEY